MNALVSTSAKPLRAHTADEARGPLLMLFSAYPEPYQDRNAEHGDKLNQAKVSAYLMGLEGLPSWAIEQSVKDFIQGRIDRPIRRKGSLPTVEEIALEARGYVEREGARQRVEASRVEQIAERSSAEVSPAERTRMKFKMAVLSAATGISGGPDMLAQANDRGLEEMIALGQRWGIPVPDELWKQLEQQA